MRSGSSVQQESFAAWRRLHAGRNPSWSPEGRRLTFTSTRGNPQQVAGAFIIKPDGTGLRQVKPSDLASHPVWSPRATMSTVFIRYLSVS